MTRPVSMHSKRRNARSFFASFQPQLVDVLADRHQFAEAADRLAVDRNVTETSVV